MNHDWRLMRHLTVAFLTLAASALGWSALGTAAALANDWPCWRGPDHTAISAEKGWATEWPTEGPKVLWKAEVGAGYSAFSIAEGKAYTLGFADGKDTVWCLDATSGKVVWKHSYPCEAGDHPGPRCSPTVDGKVVYTLSRLGDLFCLEAATGQVKWSKHLVKDFKAKVPQWGFSCSPLVLDENLVIDCGPAIVLKKATGETVWQAGEDEAGYSTPFAFKFGGKTCLALFPEFGPVVRDAADGKDLGRVRWKTTYGVNPVTPIVLGDQIFISSGYDTGAAVFQLGADGLKQVWKNRNMRNHANSCVLLNGCLYGFDGQVNQGPLTCIDFKTGEKKWSEDSLRAGSLMMADGKIIAIGHQGDLAVAQASPEGYKELAKAKILGETCWTMPVLANGLIYCRNEKGNAVCVEVKGK